MSFWSWLTPRTSQQKIQDRIDRQNYYSSGTVTQGIHKGKYLAEVQGKEVPRGVNVRELLTELSDAINNSTPLAQLLPGPLPFATERTPGIFDEPGGATKVLLTEQNQSTNLGDTEAPRVYTGLKVTLNEGANQQGNNNQIEDQLLQQAQEARGYEGLNVRLSDADEQVKAQTSKSLDDQLLEQARNAVGVGNTQQVSEPDKESSGQQLRQGFNVGGTSGPMLAWLAEAAPHILQAMAAGAGGAVAAAAARKIVGDDPPATTQLDVQKRINLLSQEESSALHNAVSSLVTPGPSNTFGGSLVQSAAPKSLGLAQPLTITPDQGQVQTIADGAMVMANSRFGGSTQPRDSQSLGLAMRGKPFGIEPKTLGNQKTLIMPPNSQGTPADIGPEGAQLQAGNFGSQLGKVAGEVRGTIGNVFKDTAVEAAQEVGSSLIHAAAPAVKEVGAAVSKRVGGWLAKGIGSITSGLLKKIVGDDVPTKVVGDAPIAGDGEIQLAIQALTSSPLATLASARLVIEQTMATMTPIPPNGSKEAVYNALISEAQPDFALYNHQPLDVEADRCGMTLWPRDIPYYSEVAGWQFVVQDPPLAKIGGTTQTGSVPFAETPGMSSVAPMLIGAPITEYSGALRIKTMRTDYDILLTIMGRLVPAMMSDRGYSFAPPLTKLTLLMSTYTMPLGTEAAELLSGVAYRPIEMFPRIQEQVFPTSIGGNWNVAAAWISLGEYAQALNGDLQAPNGNGLNVPWDARFMPEHWDITCAVIPIFREEMTDGQGNIVRILSVVEHPMFACAYKIEWMYLAQGGYVSIAQEGVDRLAQPNGILTHVEGPKAAILFVIVDMPQRRRGAVWLGNEQFLFYHNNPAEPWIWPPANPPIPNVNHLEEVIRAELANPGFPGVIMKEIQRLENMVLTASDRSSALRLAGDCTLRFTTPKTYVRTRLGMDDQVGNIRAIFRNASSGLPDMYRMQPSMGWLASLDDRMTTASCRPLLAAHQGKMIDNMPYTHRMGAYCSMLQILLMRGMVMMEEEKPQVPLAMPGPMGEVIYEVGLMTAAMTDRVMQDNSQKVEDWWGPQTADHSEDILRKLNRDNLVIPELQSVFIAGIQYPSGVVSYTNSEYPILRNRYEECFPAATGNSPIARVPRIGLAKYLGSEVPSSSIINLHPLALATPPQYMQVRAAEPNQLEQYYNCFWAEPGQDMMQFEMSKITFSAIPDMENMNPPLISVDRGRFTDLKYVGFPVTSPDASWSRAVAYSGYNRGVIDMRTECTSLPVGALLPLYDIRRSTKYAYMMSGYHGIFRSPGGSGAVKLLTTAETPAGLSDADLFPMDEPQLYMRPGSIMRL